MKKFILHLLRCLDNGLLKYSSTKLGLTDYDQNKSYDKEEKKIGLRELGAMIVVELGIVAIATILVLFVLT